MEIDGSAAPDDAVRGLECHGLWVLWYTWADRAPARLWRAPLPPQGEEESLLTIEIEDGDFAEGDVSALPAPAFRAVPSPTPTLFPLAHVAIRVRVSHAARIGPSTALHALACAAQVTYDLMGLETNSPLLRVGQKMYEGRSVSLLHSRAASALRFCRCALPRSLRTHVQPGVSLSPLLPRAPPAPIMPDRPGSNTFSARTSTSAQMLPRLAARVREPGPLAVPRGRLPTTGLRMGWEVPGGGSQGRPVVRVAAGGTHITARRARNSCSDL